MSTPAYLIHALNAAERQLRASFEGISDEQWQKSIAAESMSPIATAVHLAHCYSAFLAVSQGQSWDWEAPFDLGVAAPIAVLDKAFALRAECMSRIQSTESDSVIEQGIDFLLMHDCYHVGQLAAFRLNTDPSWDPSSIYR